MHIENDKKDEKIQSCLQFCGCNIGEDQTRHPDRFFEKQGCMFFKSMEEMGSSYQSHVVVVVEEEWVWIGWNKWSKIVSISWQEEGNEIDYVCIWMEERKDWFLHKINKDREKGKDQGSGSKDMNVTWFEFSVRLLRGMGPPWQDRQRILFYDFNSGLLICI